MKLDKRNTTMSKKMRIMFCQQFAASLSFLRFVADLKLLGSWILDALNTNFLKLSSTPNSYLPKTENKTYFEYFHILHFVYFVFYIYIYFDITLSKSNNFVKKS